MRKSFDYVGLYKFIFIYQVQFDQVYHFYKFLIVLEIVCKKMLHFNIVTLISNL